MDWLEPLGWWALAAVPVIVALYFLRTRRPPRVVASLLLWADAKRSSTKGRPWDRFRPNLLLWLQLLVIGALTLALVRPACWKQGSPSEHLVLVLDASASMGARDAEPTRWVSAIAKARQSLRDAPEGVQVALIRAGRLTRVASPMSTDRAALLRTLDTLEAQGPDVVQADMREAMLLASALGEQSEARSLILLSDGAFDHASLPEALASQARFVRVGSFDDNLAITTLEIRRAANQRFGASLLCVVTNTGSHKLAASLEIKVDGLVQEVEALELEPGASRNLSYSLDIASGQVQASLREVRGAKGIRDNLDSDNQAFAVLAPEEKLRVRVVGTNPFLLRALELGPGLAVEVSALEDPPSEPLADVVIYEGQFPETIPAGRFLAINPPEGNPMVSWGDTLEAPTVATWDEGHPVLHQVDLSLLRFGAVRQALAKDPFLPLAQWRGEGGALLLSGQSQTWKGLVWTVAMDQSDFPLRVTFPVWLYNALGWLRPGGEESLGATGRTGQALAIRAGQGATVTVTRPDGEDITHQTGPQDSDGAYLFPQTELPGFYQSLVRQGSREQRRSHGLSLVSVQESTITPAPSLVLPRGGSVSAAPSVQHSQEYTWWALLAALLLSLLEWSVYLWRTRRKV